MREIIRALDSMPFKIVLAMIAGVLSYKSALFVTTAIIASINLWGWYMEVASWAIMFVIGGAIFVVFLLVSFSVIDALEEWYGGGG